MATTEAMTTGMMFLSTCPGYCTAMQDKLVPHLAVPYAAPMAAHFRSSAAMSAHISQKDQRDGNVGGRVVDKETKGLLV
jgi:hypothetical protein